MAEKNTKGKAFPKTFRPTEKMQTIYDDIVDRSQFKSTAEQKRAMQASNQGAGDKGLYDYEAGEEIPTGKNRITDTELMLRTGKLDKADVQKLKTIAEAEASDTIEKAKLEKADRENKNRTEALDKLIGANQGEEE